MKHFSGNPGPEGSVGKAGRNAKKLQGKVSHLHKCLQNPPNLGVRGPKGLPGPGGEAGSQGDKGINGIPGEVGPIGFQGSQGLAGFRGIDGPQGEPGLQGIPGQDALVSQLFPGLLFH